MFILYGSDIDFLEKENELLKFNQVLLKINYYKRFGKLFMLVREGVNYVMSHILSKVLKVSNLNDVKMCFAKNISLQVSKNVKNVKNFEKCEKFWEMVKPFDKQESFWKHVKILQTCEKQFKKCERS